MFSLSGLSRIEKITRKGGLQLQTYFNNPSRLRMRTKSDGTSVTDADEEANELYLDLLHRNFPDADLIGEEGSRRRPDNLLRFMFDPLDGTANFIKRDPNWVTIIGAAVNGEPQGGAIYHPILDQMVVGWVGDKPHFSGGAILNGRELPLLVHHGYAIFQGAPSIGYAAWRGCPGNMREVSRVLEEKGAKLFNPGSLGFMLMQLALGYYNAVIFPGDHKHDTLAGAAIALGLGGRVTNLRGEEIVFDDTPMGGHVISRGGKLHDDILAVIRQVNGW